MECLHEIRKFI